MNEIEQLSLDTLAEEFAKNISEDKDKQIIIAAGLKQIWKAANRPTFVVPADPAVRFALYTEVDEEQKAQRKIVYDFHVIASYMNYCVFQNDYAEVHNARTGEVLKMPIPVAEAFRTYCRQVIGIEI